MWKIKYPGCGATSATAEHIIGLREIRELLSGGRTRAECLAAIQRATRRYAKRQMTWFRRETALAPISLSAASSEADVIEKLAVLVRASSPQT